MKAWKYCINAAGEYVLSGYEWISFATLKTALNWRRRNPRLRTVYDLDAHNR